LIELYIRWVPECLSTSGKLCYSTICSLSWSLLQGLTGAQ
jgi:hypothetical protein